MSLYKNIKGMNIHRQKLEEGQKQSPRMPPQHLEVGEILKVIEK